MSLSDEQKKAYVESGGGKCPYCGSFNLEGQCMDADGSMSWQEIICLECHKRWNDVYKLSEIEEIEDD